MNKVHAEHAEHGEEKDHSAPRGRNERVRHRGCTAGPGKLRVEVRLPGEVVVANPDTLASHRAALPGIAKECKNLGDPVKKGETLVVIESNDSLTAYEVKALIDGIVIEKTHRARRVGQGRCVRLHDRRPEFGLG